MHLTVGLIVIGGACLFALMGSQVWMVFRVRKQDKLVDDLGVRSLPDAVQALIEQRYVALLAECLERQPDHEREHLRAHGGHFTDALRIGNIANRLGRKIHAAGLPDLPIEERRRRAREALCRPAG